MITMEALFRKRLFIFSIVLGIAAIVIILQYAGIMLFGQTPANQTNQAAQERGPIVDRNGRLLAIQTTVFTLAAWGRNITDAYESAHLLSEIIQEDEESIYLKLKDAQGAVILQRRLDLEKASKVRDLISKGKLEGIYLEPNQARNYPEGQGAAHIVGFTGSENSGLEGLEYLLDQTLNARDTILADGRAYGNQVVLTLDSTIQHFMESMADRAVAQYNPQGLAFIVMDARNGEILASAIRPGYDPNTYTTSSAEQRRNLAISYVYEPGSVFKIFSLAMIMNHGQIGNETLFPTSGGYKNSRFRDPITDLVDYGTITPEGIIKFSSNVGAAMASEIISDREFWQDIQDLGFGSKTDVGLPGEEGGLVKALAAWSPRTKPTMAFGQELGVTVLQMLQAATALSNQGALLRPRILKRIVSADGKTLKEFPREVVRTILKPETARLMLNYMNAATEDSGTGRRSRVAGINLSVKTGTAQMIDPATSRYSSQDFIASSLGIFPTESPRIIVYIVIFKPQGEIYGGRIAAPLIKESAEFLIPYFGIDREGDQIVETGGSLKITIPVLPEMKDQVPDFRGLPASVVSALLLREDIIVEILGSGYVKTQEPSAGTLVTKGMKLSLRLDGKL